MSKRQTRTNEAEESVGYKKPPTGRRFKPGESGNPGGRPKGRKSLHATVEAVASERHTVIENGEKRSRTVLELVALSLRNAALQRDVGAFSKFLECLERYSGKEPIRPHAVLLAPAMLTDEEWDRLRAKPVPDSGMWSKPKPKPPTKA